MSYTERNKIRGDAIKLAIKEMMLGPNAGNYDERCIDVKMRMKKLERDVRKGRR